MSALMCKSLTEGTSVIKKFLDMAYRFVYPITCPSYSDWWHANNAMIQGAGYGDFIPPPEHAMSARQGAVSIEDIIKNKIAHFRRWKQTNLSKRHPRWGFQFSVMTYNILSQTAVENHRYLYKHCRNSFLQEDYRVSRLLPEILNTRSDIICLQEVEQHVFDYRIKKLFETNGFESIFKKKTSTKSDGCAILWRKNKFSLLDHCEIEFSAKGNKFLNRDNVGLIAVLRPNHPDSGDTRLHVATTHLLFNPKRGEVKLCQLRLLLAELERLALKGVTENQRQYHPVVLCGDFNIEPHSPLYQFLESGRVNLTNVLSGDMSGQKDGKNRGKALRAEQLSLSCLGINQSSRYQNSTGSVSNRYVQSTASVRNKAPTNISSAMETIDPSIVLAIGTSNDPRWLTTLKAMGQEKLAQEIASRIAAEQNVATKPEDSSNNQVELTSSAGGDIQFFHDFKFIPAYKFYNESPKDMPITSMTGHDFNTVDHIFYNVEQKENLNTYSEGLLRLLGLYSLMRTDEIKDIGGLPNAYLGSDHMCLIAQFGLCLKKH